MYKSSYNFLIDFTVFLLFLTTEVGNVTQGFFFFKCAATDLLQSWLLSLLFSPIFPPFPVFTQYNIMAVFFYFLLLCFPNSAILSTAVVLTCDLKAQVAIHCVVFFSFDVISGFIPLPGSHVTWERDWRKRKRERAIYKGVRDGVFEFLFAILREAPKQGFYYGNWQGTNSAF